MSPSDYYVSTFHRWDDLLVGTQLFLQSWRPEGIAYIPGNGSAMAEKVKLRGIFTDPLKLLFKIRIFSDINKMQIITQGRGDSVVISVRSQRS